MKKRYKKIFSTNRLSIQIARVIGLVMLVLVVYQIIYFTSFYRYREESLEEASEVVAKSIAVAIDAMFDDIKASALAFAFSEDVADFIAFENGIERYEAHQKVSELSRFVSTYNEEVSNIILISEDQEAYAFKTDIEHMLVETVYGQFTKESLLDGEQALFFASHNQKPQNAKLELVVFRTPVYAQTESSGNFYVEVGAMLFEMRTEGLYRIIDSNQEYSGIVITINDRYGNTISIGEAEDVDYIDVVTSIEAFEVDITVSQPKNYFNDDGRYFSFWLVVNLALFGLMVILVGYIVYSRITLPVDGLIDEIKQLHMGSKKKHIDIEKNEVVSVIGDEINILMDKNREQTRKIMNTQQRLFEVEISEKEAQFHALQLQINPHFLYNTLSCIKAKALMNDSEDIAGMTTSMAKIFRYSIQKEKYVSVGQEINFINEYLKIMRVRYEDKYTFTLTMDKGLDGYQSLKMILQPIIENAIKHGLDNRRQPGHVQIEVKEVQDDLIYKVMDDGIGFTDDRLDEVLSALDDPNVSAIGKSIGLVNVHRRLRNNFGDGYGVRIKEELGHTVVEVVQPMKEYDR